MTSTTYESVAPDSDLRRHGIRLGDVLFQGISVVASLAATVLLFWITYKVLDLAWPAIQQFGLSFVWTDAWDPVKGVYGALAFVYGPLVRWAIALGVP